MPLAKCLVDGMDTLPMPIHNNNVEGNVGWIVRNDTTEEKKNHKTGSILLSNCYYEVLRIHSHGL